MILPSPSRTAAILASACVWVACGTPEPPTDEPATAAPATAPVVAVNPATPEELNMPTDELVLTLTPQCKALVGGAPCPFEVRFTNGTQAEVPLHRAGFEAGLDLQLLVRPAGGEAMPLGFVRGIEPGTDEASLAPLAPGESLTTTADVSSMMMGLILGPGDLLQFHAEYRPDRTLSLAKGEPAAVPKSPERVVVSAPVELVVE